MVSLLKIHLKWPIACLFVLGTLLFLVPVFWNASGASARPVDVQAHEAKEDADKPSGGPNPCFVFATGVSSTSCQSLPGTYSYSFQFYIEEGCLGPASGTAYLKFYVSNNPMGPFTLYDTQTQGVYFPAGPSYTTISGALTVTGVPASNYYYKIELDAGSVAPGAVITSGVGNLCVVATPTPPSCPVSFTDVDVSSPFYSGINCLSCRGIIGGYISGCETGNPCFRPGNNITRAQLSKVVSIAAGFTEPATYQYYEDVPPGSPFFDFVYRLALRSYVSGYACGGAGEPCVSPGNLPYFRPGNYVTRGQLSKLVSNGAGFTDPPGAQVYQDVPVGSTFYDYIQRLTSRSAVGGYPCGGAGEPCGPGSMPYFRPNSTASRGQTSKIVAKAFFPTCVTP